jgi:serine/threonine-protein kinase RsbW
MSKIVFDVLDDLHSIRKAVCTAVNFIKSECTNISDSNVFDIKIILNEILTNSIRHGCRNDFNCIANVVIGITLNHEVFMIIKDYGNGFDHLSAYNKCENLDLCIDNIQESGRGILIIKNLSDRVKFNKKGNKIVVIKKLLKNS